ncbi:MAG: FAD-dependent oxidoreductase, partial [Pseudomonadota bacterium]
MSSDMIERLARQDVPPWAAGTQGREQELYPKLNDEEIGIVRSYAEERRFAAGDYLWQRGDVSPFYLMLDGDVEVLRVEADGEHVIIAHGAGRYVGEIPSMTGANALVAGRAVTDVHALYVKPDDLRQLIATEADLGEKILLSFILRRMRMIAANLGNVTLIAATETPEGGDLQRFLSRNGLPFEVLHPKRDAEVVEQRLGHVPQELPVLLCSNETLVRPTHRQVAENLGFTAQFDCGVTYDLVVIGSGPAGMAAAVYGASEGLSVLVLERCAPGGQAGSSSRIENYMGFPTGISGQALMGRAYLQAQKFGATVAVARELKTLEIGNPLHKLRLDGGDLVHAKALVIASGAVYRQPAIEGLAESGGVHYGASHVEGELCRGRDVAIVGGGNSAGQAAVYLSQRARNVHILVRGNGLGHSMSDYLIQRIERIPNVFLHTHSEVDAVEGGKVLDEVVRHAVPESVAAHEDVHVAGAL